MYKSIIFDIGGVLVDFDPKAYLVDRLCNAEMEEKVYDLTFGSEEWQLLDAGKLSRYDGNQRMLERARAEGCAFEVQGVLDDWMHILRPASADAGAGAAAEEPRLLRVLPEQHPAGCAGIADRARRSGSV